jgi:hypothetical protein
MKVMTCKVAVRYGFCVGVQNHTPTVLHETLKGFGGTPLIQEKMKLIF